VPLTEGAISTLPGLLQPYFEARKTTAYELWDDNDLPLANGAAEDARRVLLGRPEVSSVNGRIMLGKRKRDVGLTGGAGLGIAMGSVGRSTQGSQTQGTKKAKASNTVV
jgi:hypothetical protein